MKLLFKEEIQMSTNHTQNYSLCQWEPADRVLREDFNADNAALDAALARIEATASAAKTQAQQLSDTAYTTGFPPFVAGAYSGNNVNGRVIELGFRPKFVFVVPTALRFDTTEFFGMAVDGRSAVHLQIVDDGFKLSADPYGNGTNGNGTFIYFAFR